MQYFLFKSLKNLKISKIFCRTPKNPKIIQNLVKLCVKNIEKNTLIANTVIIVYLINVFVVQHKKENQEERLKNVLATFLRRV